MGGVANPPFSLSVEPHMLAGKGDLEVVGDAVLDADIVREADPGFV